MSWSRLAALGQSRQDRRQGTARPSWRKRTAGGAGASGSNRHRLGNRSRKLSRARDHERRLRRWHARPARDVRAVPQRGGLALRSNPRAIEPFLSPGAPRLTGLAPPAPLCLSKNRRLRGTKSIFVTAITAAVPSP